MIENEVLMDVTRSGPMELAGGGGVLLRSSATPSVFPPRGTPARRRTITLVAESSTQKEES